MRLHTVLITIDIYDFVDFSFPIKFGILVSQLQVVFVNPLFILVSNITSSGRPGGGWPGRPEEARLEDGLPGRRRMACHAAPCCTTSSTAEQRPSAVAAVAAEPLGPAETDARSVYVGNVDTSATNELLSAIAGRPEEARA